jgi:hypothetical protein
VAHHGYLSLGLGLLPFISALFFDLLLRQGMRMAFAGHRRRPLRRLFGAGAIGLRSLCAALVRPGQKTGTPFLGRWSHSEQITATAAGSGRPRLMQPHANW